MSLSARWRRFDAPSWVYRLCMLYAVVACLMTVPALFAGFGLGTPWLVLLPPAVAVCCVRLALAWDDERRWAWVVLAALSGVGGGDALLSLALDGPSLSTVLALLLDAVMFTLLLHPDSREVLDPRPPPIHVGAPRDTFGGGW